MPNMLFIVSEFVWPKTTDLPAPLPSFAVGFTSAPGSAPLASFSSLFFSFNFSLLSLFFSFFLANASGLSFLCGGASSDLLFMVAEIRWNEIEACNEVNLDMKRLLNCRDMIWVMVNSDEE